MKRFLAVFAQVMLERLRASPGGPLVDQIPIWNGSSVRSDVDVIACLELSPENLTLEPLKTGGVQP